MSTVPAPRSATTETGAETALTLLALGAGGISSLLIVTATAGWFPMPVLFWAIDLPGMAIVAAVYIYARTVGLERLQRRIAVGVVGGVALTLALDAVRVAGVHLGYLPDSITMFGNLIVGAMPMAEPTPAGYTLGAVYHLFNGISFGLVYSIVSAAPAGGARCSTPSCSSRPA